MMPTNIHLWIKDVSQLITGRHITALLTALLILFIGLFLSRRAKAAVGNFKNLDPQKRMLLEKFAHLGLIFLSCALALDTLGFDLKVLLGAAGVLTVAIGFAAQTSASNLISGLFLMFERPFVVGDTVAVSDVRGEVMAIDLLSTKIRTFNNTMVRVPNESLVKSNITNLSYFPIRRVDLEIGVEYGCSLANVEKVVRETIAGHPEILHHPLPSFLMKGFGASSIDFDIQVWTETVEVANVRSELYLALNRAFQQNGINIPFPTRTIVHQNAGHAPTD
jgi:small-conductance mechanosensitive channel